MNSIGTWSMMSCTSHFNEQLSAMGAFLNVRVTYELMAGFWLEMTPSSKVSSSPSVASLGQCSIHTRRSGSSTRIVAVRADQLGRSSM